jgi:ankyrin repeat protein
MAINDISLASRILDYQNDDNVIDFINSRKCTKATVNEIGKNNMTPLHIAACNNKYEIAKALLKKGADVNGLFYEMDKPGLPPLHMAVYYGSYDNEEKENNLKTINLLLKAKADIDISSHSAFLLACIKSKNEVIKLLLDYDIDIQFKGEIAGAYLGGTKAKTGLDYMQDNGNEAGIKIIKAYMLNKELEKELNLTDKVISNKKAKV